MRQNPATVRGYAVTHPSGTVVLPTAPGWDLLLYASAGVMTVDGDAGRWVVPPHRALWMPEGTDYRILMHGRVSVRTLYFPTSIEALPREWRAVNVPPLLRELILHAVRTCPLEMARPDHERLVAVIVDQLATLADAPLQLPMPSDSRALALAAALAADTGTETRIRELAQSAGASRRTLERVFAMETGMTIGRWRQRLRLIRALELLAAGESVTAVAAAVGYSTPSAFGVMFRDHLGEPPGRYFAAQ